MKRPLVIASLIAPAVVIIAALILRPKDPACVRLDAKLALAEDFCQGLAEQAAHEKCSSLSEDPEVLGQCLRVIVPAAHSSCMGYLNVERLKRQAQDLCS